MVSAVFHSPLDATAPASPAARRPPERDATQLIAATAGEEGATALFDSKTLAAGASPARPARDFSFIWQFILPPVLGLGLLALVWELVSLGTGASIPSPKDTFWQAVQIFSDPFYSKGPNDQGVGWNVLSSLKRVAMGFGLAAIVGIPVGFMIGRFTFLSRMFNPLISLMRPVSPLAWLPIGLLVFKGANPAAIWTIFICSIWPMIINTAVGVQRVPQDYMNVARVLNLSEWKIVTKILFPAVLPYMLTGVRLAVGTAWLVIVAAEMLTGGVGIGFWVWDEWNNLNVKNIIIAIFVIGIVGLLLEFALIKLATAFTFEEVKN
ncbi:nitrate ABC transporter permease [Polaromonas sp.]|jgi:nitrate/nitrite transport system permease protein|uniref:nitrate ABC transporter permease n=1 Tax=Polaromonas sp. TaxID=1869339 RepID=UPI002CC6F2E1|nr:nitrate ABC transporter permease [Polaromonas sp.]HQS30143.1 nitrate ABC transporter permease [Polaromonas sp.]HQS89540.1 nitrate ABC transporter permease [Polaromonas sp.]